MIFHDRGNPVCNLSLPLSAQPNLGVLCAWSNTHTVAVPHHGLYNFTAFFFFGNVWFYFILARKKTTVHNKTEKNLQRNKK